VETFAILSMPLGPVTPHFNGGYEWNGNSRLVAAGANREGSLPDRLFYTLGFDAELATHATKRFTVSADFSHQFVKGGAVLRGDAAPGTPILFAGFTQQRYHEVNAAFGFKAGVAANLVFMSNFLVRLNESGLRARVVPNVGLSYLFGPDTGGRTESANVRRARHAWR
jgi:hypothetical protein